MGEIPTPTQRPSGVYECNWPKIETEETRMSTVLWSTKQKPVKQATTMTTENSSTAAAATNDDADQPTECPTDRASDRPTDHGRRRRRLGPCAWCGGAAPTLVAMSSGSRGDGTPCCSCGKHRLTPLKTASLRAAWAQEEGVKWATRSTWFHA